jgi:hypothetical protein
MTATDYKTTNKDVLQGFKTIPHALAMAPKSAVMPLSQAEFQKYRPPLLPAEPLLTIQEM